MMTKEERDRLKSIVRTALYACQEARSGLDAFDELMAEEQRLRTKVYAIRIIVERDMEP